jgi:molybdopterin converting factor small subunit
MLWEGRSGGPLVIYSGMTETAGSVTLTVQFLARYAELVGTGSTTITLRAPATVAHVLGAVRSQFPGARRIPDHPMCALNLAQVDLSTTVSNGDELALLPPVAGG